jgi:tetratricopeptide (TPR) repeat protein
MADTWTQGDEGRGILFGSLALQLDLLDAAQFIDACESWNAARHVPLAEWIGQRGRLQPEARYEIERVLARKVARFRGDLRAANREMLSSHLQRTLRAVRNPELGAALAPLVQATEERSTAQRATDRWGEPVTDVPHRPAEAPYEECPAAQSGGWQDWVRRHRALVNWTVTVALVAVLCVAAGMSLLNDNNHKLFGQRGFAQNGGPFPPIVEANAENENALQLVMGLYLTLGKKETVLDHLKHDRALTDEFRKRALLLAEDDPERARLLNNAGWYLARQPGLEAASYERALALAEEACRLVPLDSNFLNSLGVAQYRCGTYEQALKTLQRSEPLNAREPSGPHPADLAFLAMAHFRLGQKEKAMAELQRLRKAVELWQQSWRNQQAPLFWQEAQVQEARAFLHETEQLLQVPFTTFKDTPHRKLRAVLPR